MQYEIKSALTFAKQTSLQSNFTRKANFTCRKANLVEKTTSKEVVFFGGDGEDRTLDLLNAIQALSQYTQKRTPTQIILSAILMFFMVTVEDLG